MINTDFSLDEYELRELNLMINHIKDDFDFIGLFSGHGGVRIGKSVKAMQYGAYITSEVNRIYKLENPWNEVDNFAFKGEELIEKAKRLPPYSVIIYDEAGSDLVNRKYMQATTQALLDFFRECGQLNLFLMCVLPDFFDLPKQIAINRSNYLVDIDYREGFTRGKYSFYGPKKKKILYIMGKKYYDYDCVRPDFKGHFMNRYTVDEQKYRARKYEALTGRKKDAEDKKTRREVTSITQRDNLIYYVLEKGLMTQVEIADVTKMPQPTVSSIKKRKDGY